MCVVNQKSKSSNFPCNLSTFSNQLCPQCPLRLFKSQLPRICLPIIAFNQGYIQASSPLPIATTNRLQSMTTLLFTQLPTTASISSNQYQIMQNLRAAREGDTSLCLSLRGQPRVRGLFRSCWCWFAAGCVWPAGGQLGCARVISIFLGQISLGASILTFNNYKNRSCSLHSFIWWNRGAKRTISSMAEQVSTFLDQQFLFVLDWRYYFLRVVSLQNNHNRLLYNSCSPKERPIASRGNNVPNKFYYYIQSMAEPEQKVSIKQDVSEQLSQNYEYRDQQLNAYEDDHECELDLEQKYFQKLKQQRKRIEELSLLHQSYEERLEREGERNRGLREEVEKLAGFKEYHARYSESVASLQLLAQENRSLKEHNEDLKQQNYQSTIDKANLVQKLRLEVSLLRDKESAKVQSLEEELYAKQEELDRLAREFKAKEKEYQEGLSGLRAKMAALDNEKHEQLRTQQRKVEKLEKELAYRSESYSESQSNTDSLLKESSRQKEDNYRLNSLLASREIEFKSLGEKYRRHMAGCRKDAANRDKECQELKETLRKYEKEAKDCASESEILRAEVRKVKETLQLERGRWVSDFSKEKSALQATILQHSRTIEELLEIKNGLMADKAKLQSILKKKTDCENKRLSFLKSEWKEINKLEKVIDKIIE